MINCAAKMFKPVCHYKIRHRKHKIVARCLVKYILRNPYDRRFTFDNKPGQPVIGISDNVCSFLSNHDKRAFVPH